MRLPLHVVHTNYSGHLGPMHFQGVLHEVDNRLTGRHPNRIPGNRCVKPVVAAHYSETRSF